MARRLGGRASCRNKFASYIAINMPSPVLEKAARAATYLTQYVRGQEEETWQE